MLEFDNAPIGAVTACARPAKLPPSLIVKSISMAAPDAPKFPNRIRALRKARGWTQMALADKVNMSYQNVGKIERGDVNLYAHHLDRFAAVFECRPSELLSSEHELTGMERDLLRMFAQMTPEHQVIWMRMGSTLVENHGGENDNGDGGNGHRPPSLDKATG